MNRLIERYLLHVKSHLPKSLRDDVAAEIEEGLRLKIEDRERETGSPITDDELGDMLSDWGHPLVVAGQYLPRQYLIGPSTFPAYWNALRALIAVFVAIAVFKSIVVAATGDWREIFPGLGNTLWALVAWAGIITVLFAVIDEKGIRFFEHFDAKKLRERHLSPDGVPAQPITRFESAFEIVFTSVVLLWWVGAFGLLSLPAWNVEGWQLSVFFVEIAWGEAFGRFFYPVLGLLLLGILLSVRNFVRPYWTLASTGFRLGLNLVAVGIVIWAMRTPELISFTVAANAPNPARLEAMLPEILGSLRVILVIGIVITSIRIAVGVGRIIRYRH